MQTWKGDCIFPFCCHFPYNVSFINLQLLPDPFQGSGAYSQNTEYGVEIHPEWEASPWTGHQPHKFSHLFAPRGNFV